MKSILEKFADRLLTDQQLKAIKGGTPYCFDCDGRPVDCAPGQPPGSNPGECVCSGGLYGC